MNCPKCLKQMILIKDNSVFGNLRWYCPNCDSKLGILYGSIFSNSKIPLNKIYHLLYCWVFEYSCKQTSHEINLNKNTVTYYFTLFRNACDSYVCSNTSKIGGPGKTVQIDETLMCKRKYNVGRMLNEIWIFGGICVEDHQFFCLVVNNRTTEELSQAIQKYINIGTTIISDCWKAYNYLDNSKNYNHFTVDHSKNFINPDNGANTQMIERMWRSLKKINKRYEGIPRDSIQEHISEFIWRCNVLKYSNNKFQTAIELIADTKFLQITD